MTLRQLEMVMAVARVGSFSRAARALQLSQPGVSQGIGELEAELGVTLFRRAQARVSLTDIGRRLLPHARAALLGAGRIREASSAARGLDRGKLRLGVLTSASAVLLPRLLAAFRVRHPRIEVRTLEGSDEEVRAWLRDEVVDVGLLTLPAPGLDTTLLGRDRWLAVLPRLHPLGALDAVSLRQLAAEPFILARGGCEGRLLERMRAEGLPLDVRHEVRDAGTLLALVREGRGVAVLGEWALPAARQGLAIRPVTPRTWRMFGLAMRGGRRGETLPATFVDVARRMRPRRERAG
jgi:DNA-binding transcriptional LysR family regulator